MKKLVPLLCMLSMTSCSSIPKSNIEEQNEAIMKHLTKGKQIIGKDFESKFEKDGMHNGEYLSIGSVTGLVNDNEKQLIALASAEARSKLFESAPMEFKKVVQHALSSSLGGNGSIDSIAISIHEVKALTGLTNNFNDIKCVVYATPNTELGFDYAKECRVIFRVSGPNLLKSYNYTLNKKYGLKEESAIKDILKQQLMEKILDNESKEHKEVN
jgi:hypothetical protein